MVQPKTPRLPCFLCFPYHLNPFRHPLSHHFKIHSLEQPEWSSPNITRCAGPLKNLFLVFTPANTLCRQLWLMPVASFVSIRVVLVQQACRKERNGTMEASTEMSESERQGRILLLSWNPGRQCLMNNECLVKLWAWWDKEYPPLYSYGELLGRAANISVREQLCVQKLAEP